MMLLWMEENQPNPRKALGPFLPDSPEVSVCLGRRSKTRHWRNWTRFQPLIVDTTSKRYVLKHTLGFDHLNRHDKLPQHIGADTDGILSGSKSSEIDDLLPTTVRPCLGRFL